MSTTETPTLAQNVTDARNAIMEALHEGGREKTWDARKLMDAACEGTRGTVASIALWNLAAEGQLVMNEDGQVTLPSDSPS